jgi:succinate dehydrogenase hydrophobic anchor subunit
VQGAIASWIGQIVLFGATFAFFLHLCGGIRHLAWDTVHGFELRSIYASGWAVVAASVVLTVAAWVASLEPMNGERMRSPLGRALGLGSAKEGVEHWWAERVSAVALAPLTLWLAASSLCIWTAITLFSSAG